MTNATDSANPANPARLITRRLLATVIDRAATGLLAILVIFDGREPVIVLFLAALAGLALGPEISAHCLGRRGATPGMRLMGLQARRADGQSVGDRERDLRVVPERCMTLLILLGLVAYGQYGITWREQRDLMRCWLALELLRLLVESTLLLVIRRTIADHLAGTALVRAGAAPHGDPDRDDGLPVIRAYYFGGLAAFVILATTPVLIE